MTVQCRFDEGLMNFRVRLLAPVGRPGTLFRNITKIPAKTQGTPLGTKNFW
jgi:hypothetical protein